MCVCCVLSQSRQNILKEDGDEDGNGVDDAATDADGGDEKTTKTNSVNWNHKDYRNENVSTENLCRSEKKCASLTKHT